MIHLKLRSSYNFKQSYGLPDQLIDAVEGNAAGIADNNTWGHVLFFNACKDRGIKPILGIQIAISNAEITERKKENYNFMTFIAKNNKGLKELYHIATKAMGNFYYIPRLNWRSVKEVSENIIILSGNMPKEPLLELPNVYREVNPSFHSWNVKAIKSGEPIVPTADVFFPLGGDRDAYQALTGMNEVTQTTPMHILTEAEMKLRMPGVPQSAYDFTHELADTIDVALPKAKMVTFKNIDLLAMCRVGVEHREKIKWNDVYEARMNHELQIILSKGFENYFYLVADVVKYAKQHMLVGAGRGSAAGSLVSYLLGITDVDPIQHGLIFERFIDVTRHDLPDIDLDFPDNKREQVFDYLINKYGHNAVAKIGVISKYRPKALLVDLGKFFKIPVYEMEKLKKVMIERPDGDERANDCIQDTINTVKPAIEFIERFPQIRIATRLEGHPRHSGVHAAGVIVCDGRVRDYCSINPETGIASIDKYDAEKLDILKLDLLGLRTLTILDSVLDQIKKEREWLLEIKLNDSKAFGLMNTNNLTGIFQFEGQSLKALNHKMQITEFNDIVALTSLARPGALRGGGANLFVERKSGKAEIKYMHKTLKPFVEETLGVIVYQEQIMKISKEIGNMSWKDVMKLRKVMGKSLGEEAFNEYFEKFRAGALSHGIDDKTITLIWGTMLTFGGYAFNKSHAVSYAMLSYWCAYLKARHPLQFALACLQNEKDEKSTIKLLRELVKEGFKYKPFDEKHSKIHWSIQGKALIGGFTNIKGIGEKKAQKMIDKIEVGAKLTPGEQKSIDQGKTPFDDIFECQRRFADYFKNPTDHGITSTELSHVVDVQEVGNYVFIGKITEKMPKDLKDFEPETEFIGNTNYLNLIVEDDTDEIMCTITRHKYPVFGRNIHDQDNIGKWFLIKGNVGKNFRKIYVDKMRMLEDDD